MLPVPRAVVVSMSRRRSVTSPLDWLFTLKWRYTATENNPAPRHTTARVTRSHCFRANKVLTIIAHGGSDDDIRCPSSAQCSLSRGKNREAEVGLCSRSISQHCPGGPPCTP